MSSSLTPEQVTENAPREKDELKAQVKYLQTQLGQLLEVKRKSLRNSRSPMKQGLSLNPRRKAIKMAPPVMKVQKQGHSSLKGEATLILTLIFPSLKASCTQTSS